MTYRPLNKLRALRNKTQKKRQSIVHDLQMLTPAQRSLVCKSSTNAYDTFEDKAEEELKKIILTFFLQAII